MPLTATDLANTADMLTRSIQSYEAFERGVIQERQAATTLINEMIARLDTVLTQKEG